MKRIKQLDYIFSIIELNGTDLDWGRYRDKADMTFQLTHRDTNNIQHYKTSDRHERAFKNLAVNLDKRKFLVRAYVTDIRGCRGKDKISTITGWLI